MHLFKLDQNLLSDTGFSTNSTGIKSFLANNGLKFLHISGS